MENKGYINYGQHIGDVNFNESQPTIMPSVGQVGAMCCPRCKNTVWADSPNCIFCTFDIRAYCKKRSLEWEVERLTYKENTAGAAMTGLFFILLICFYFFGSHPLLLIIFVACVIAMSFYNGFGEKKKELKEKIKEYNYLCY